MIILIANTVNLFLVKVLILCPLKNQIFYYFIKNAWLSCIFREFLMEVGQKWANHFEITLKTKYYIENQFAVNYV